MDITGRKALSHNEDIIVKDLHGDIVIQLQENKVLSIEEVEAINSHASQEDKNKMFLDILINKNDEALDLFLLSLKEWYWWIEKDIKSTMENERIKIQKIKQWEDDVAQSNIPPLPRVNIPRDDLLKEVRNALKNMGRGQYVVLEGMSGCGKSSLAAEALHDHIFIEKFKGKVHWMNCGSEEHKQDGPDDNELLGLQVQLNEWFCDEELVKNVYTSNAQTLNTKLRKRFEKSKNHEGLLVLDDVNSKKVIEALRIGCKTLLITSDSDLLDINRNVKIKVREGFTEKESLQHFAMCVGLPVAKLPEQAKYIHENGKGHPMIISLIGAQLGDRPEEAQDPASWQPFLNLLVSKEYEKMERRFSYGDKQLLPKTIKFCISNLNTDMQEKYQDFALFVEDINIKPEVLAILWDESLSDVNMRMDEFHKKNLIVRKYNPVQKNYVYGIHDILLYYLKKQYNDPENKKFYGKAHELHEKLINMYLRCSNNDISKVAKTDDYFHIYIGYHIAHAKLFRMFKEWYFNLNFIEAKLNVSLPGDLLIDYKRYKDHFVDSLDESSRANDSKKLADFVKFVESWGHDIRRSLGPDIVQYALQEPQDSAVNKAALREESRRRDVTYLRLLPPSCLLMFQLGPSDSHSAPREVTIKRGKVTAVSFVLNFKYIIVGFESGDIQIIKENGYQIMQFEGHDDIINRLSISVPKNLLLSIAGTSVKTWLTPDLKGDTDTFGCGARTPSPIQRQEGYTDIFTDYRSGKKPCFQAFSHFSHPVDWACFSADGNKIAICSSKEKRIQIYQREIKKYITLFEIKGAPATSCTFMHSDEQLIVGCSNSDIRIYPMNYSNHRMVTHTASCFDSYPTQAIVNLPESKFAVLTSKTLSVWESDTNANNSDCVRNMKDKNTRCLRQYPNETNETYQCCAVAPDGSFMAVATSSGKILICKVSDGSLFRELSTSSGNVKYLEIDSSEEHNLVVCLEDGSVKLWTIGDVLAGAPTVMSQDFAVAWTPNSLGSQEPTIVASTSTGVKKVHASVTRNNAFETFKPTEEHVDLPLLPSIKEKEKCLCSISKCAKYIMVATRCQVFIVINSDQKMGKISKVLDVNSEKNKICKVKVDVVKKTIIASIMLEKSVKILRFKEESIDNPNGIETVEIGKTLDRMKELYFIPDTESLITIGSNGCIKRSNNILSNITTRTVIPASFDVNVNATDLNCNMILAILDDKGKLIIVHNLVNDKKLYEKRLNWTPDCCSFSPNGEKLVYGCHNDSKTEIIIEVLDTQTGDVISEMTVASRSVHSVCVSDGGVAVALVLDLVVVGGAVPRGMARLQALRVVMAPNGTCAVTIDSGGHHHMITWGSNISAFDLAQPRPRRMANPTSTLVD